jgi:hypothetical protein
MKMVIAAVVVVLAVTFIQPAKADAGEWKWVAYIHAHTIQVGHSIHNGWLWTSHSTHQGWMLAGHGIHNGWLWTENHAVKAAGSVRDYWRKMFHRQ